MVQVPHASDVHPPPSAPLDYAPPAAAKRRLDYFALATHLAAWLLVLLLSSGVGIYIVPRFERLYADFAIGLPRSTKLLIEISLATRDNGMLLALLPLCLLHALAAAWWYRRATPGQKLAYRL